MGDCDNVEFRELLPERAAGTLDATTVASVDRHVASCALCREELDVLERARRVMHRAPALDTARIASVVVTSTRRVSVARVARVQRGSRWPAVRMAASLALAAAGLTTFGIWRGSRTEPGSTTVVAVATPAIGAGLAPAGGLSGLDDAQLSALLDDLASLEAAPATEPEAVVPQLADLAPEDIQ
jgi:hypothetical protein